MRSLGLKLYIVFLPNHLPESLVRSSTLSLQTAWTGFDPYSGGSSIAGSTLVENSYCKVGWNMMGHH